MHDLDECGARIPGRYTQLISTSYLNKFWVRDFEEVFAGSGLDWSIRLQPFGSRLASWTRHLWRIPRLRELTHGYLWACLKKLRT